jgi:hypothetical protein
MKQSLRGLRNVTRGFAFVLVMMGLSLLGSPVTAQDHTMSYQGTLNQNEASVSDGLYQLKVTLHADPQGKNAIWTDTYSTEVKGGIFTIQLGLGKALPDSKTMDQPLWLGVSVNGTDEQRPLTKLGAVSLALNVADQAITLKKLAPEVISVFGSTQDDQAMNPSAAVWGELGNFALTPNLHFLGTTDASHLDLRVNNLRVMKYADASTATYEANNILGGWSGNTIGGGSGNVLAGGGYRTFSASWINHPNHIGNLVSASNFNFLGGGSDNQLNSNYGVLVGGDANLVIGQWAFLGGGWGNQVGDACTPTPCPGEYASLVGGYDNWAGGEYSFIGGGLNNTAGYTSSVVGGGSNTAGGSYATVLGGQTNSVSGARSSILGGGFLTLTGDNNIGFHGYDATSGAASISTSNTAYFGNVDLWLYNNDGIGHQLRFYEPLTGGGGTNYSSFRATDQITENIEYILPSTSVSALNKVLGITTQTGTTTLTNTLGWIDPDVNAWKLTGNNNTTPLGDGGPNYLGTSNAKNFEIHIYESDAANKGSKRVMRYEYTSVSPNLLGGYQSNLISSGVIGATITGGGKNGEINTVSSAYAFIGGGSDNTINPDGTDPEENSNSYSVIAGGRTNIINPNIDPNALGGWSTISGGKNNTIAARGSSINGGEGNQVNDSYSTLAGGYNNTINGPFNSNAGGYKNTLSSKAGQTISGGLNNNAGGYGAFVGGGGGDRIGAGSTDYNNADATFAAISGGRGNHVEGPYGYIGGGRDNMMSEGDVNDTSDISYNTITGGRENLIREADDEITSDVNYAFIGGGHNNDAVNDGAVVGGGRNNYAQGYFSFIGGGGDTLISDPPRLSDPDNTLYKNSTYGIYDVLGGGQGNVINGDFNTITGGWLNVIETAEDHKNNYCFIGGGKNNRITIDIVPDEEDLPGITIAGGMDNTASEKGSAIGGGEANQTLGEFATISGGSNNTADLGAFIGGGERNTANTGEVLGFNVIGGGGFNATSGAYNFIGGGGKPNTDWEDGDPLPASLSTEGNTIQGDFSNIVGGARNLIDDPVRYGSIGGGWKNNITSNFFGTIPGGYGLFCNSFARTVLGSFNINTTSATESNFQTAAFEDRRIFIIGNGKPEIEMPLPDPDVPAVRHNAYEVSYNGHSIVYDNLGVDWQVVYPDPLPPGTATAVAVSTRPAVKGARYVDNTPIAWGRVHVEPAPPALPIVTVTAGYGVKAVSPVVVGTYKIELDYIDPYVSTPTQVRADRGSSVVATIEGTDNGYNCLFINTVPVSWNITSNRNECFVKICKQTFTAPSTLNCSAEDHDFMFVVFGRPDRQ